jgi:3-oxoacyl-[acyl-carrier protein] reductase
MDWGAEDNWPEELAKELRDSGVRVAHLEVNLAELDAPFQILDEAKSTFGSPTILVNNATHSSSDGFRNLNAAILDAHYMWAASSE